MEGKPLLQFHNACLILWHVFLIPRLFKVVTAALLKTVDSARCKELEGGLAEGLLRWNRPPSLSWYKGRGGEKVVTAAKVPGNIAKLRTFSPTGAPWHQTFLDERGLLKWR